MKKHSGVMAGIVVTLWYCIVETFLFNLPFEYNEKYAVLQNSILFILPSVSGVLSVLFLRRDTMKDFFKSLGTYFISSFIFMILYISGGLSKMMHFWFSGYEELSMGHGMLALVILSTHLVSCFIGVFVAGMISLYRQKRKPINL